ncbi:MAG: NUDIX domain-containing protein [Chloroflexota bacterium]|nr:NUDIX domain-containing protein [Chloroflexota bacterium]
MAGRFSVNVLAIIPDKQRRVLLMRYSENGEWTLPSGSVRNNEKLQQALIRNVQERTGLHIEVVQLFETSKDDNQHIINYFFHCHEIGGILTLSPWAVEFGSFSLEDIPANIDPLLRNRLFTFWRDPRPRLEELPELDLDQEEETTPSTALLDNVETTPSTALLDNVETRPTNLPKPQVTALKSVPETEPKLVMEPEKKRPRRLVWFGPSLIVLSALLLYSITRRGYFLADDFISLNQLNFKYTTFADNLVWFGRDWGVGVAFYRPWVRLSYYFEFLFFGNNPAGWHLFSTGLHTFNSLLVYLLTLLLVRRFGIATLAGLIFALHPIHTEPVSWISGQTDLWATFFTLATTCAFVRVRQLEKQKRPHRKIYLLALFSFIMALFSKEAAIVLPVGLLAYDFVNGGLDRLALKLHNKVAPPGSGWLGLLRYQAPFWLLLLGYFGLRLALFNGLGGYETEAGQLPNFGLFLSSYLHWLALPFGLGGTDGLILLLVVVAFLVLAGVQEWERFRLSQSEAVLITRFVPTFWNLRTAGYGLAWAAIFLLPTILTAPSERFTYLPSVGFALFLAVCLTPFAPFLVAERTNAVRQALIRFRGYFDLSNMLRVSTFAVLLITYFVTANSRIHQWNEAGDTVHELLDRTKEVIPGVVNYSVFISQGVPESGTAALIFRTGYPEAIQWLYRDATLDARRVPHFPIVEAHLDRTIFLQYLPGKIINHLEIVKTLLERNANLKKEKNFLIWDFTSPTLGNSPLGNWSEISGQGVVVVTNGVLQLTAPGRAEIQSSGINLPAAQLGTVEITLRASPRVGSVSQSYKISASWEPLSTGDSRAIPDILEVPFEIKADGQFHTYQIKPPVVENYNYTDTIAYLQLHLPADLDNVALQAVRQNSIPISYINLTS